MSATAVANLRWSETNPGWNVDVTVTLDEDTQVGTSGEGAGPNPVTILYRLIDEAALELNCHPGKINVIAKFNSLDLQYVARRWPEGD